MQDRNKNRYVMNKTYRIGIDFGGSRIKIGVVDDSDELIFTDIKTIRSNKFLKPILTSLEPYLQNLIIKFKMKVIGIGMTFPCIVDSNTGKILYTSSKYVDSVNIDLQDWLFNKFGLTSKIGTDSRMACLGEWKFGAGKGIDDFVMLTLGTGIGSSAVVGGSLLKGKHFQAGMLAGHMIIDYNNKTSRCGVGQYGCVESLGSITSVRKIIKGHPLFKGSALCKEKAPNWEDILFYSNAGDPLAKLIQKYCLKVWAIALVNLIQAYDPEVIVVGGGISNSDKALFPAFKQIFKDQAWSAWGIPDFRRAKYPNNAAIMGITSLLR